LVDLPIYHLLMIGRKKLISSSNKIEIMNSNRYTVVFLFLIFSNSLVAQRFVEEMFNVNITSNVVYAENISVLSDTVAIPLVMDVYTPDEEVTVDRPLVLLFHTGTFLPPIFNGQITGSKVDSSNVEICRRLARRGYVAASVSYRQGWNPQATGPEGQNIRTGTLLNAAYRGIQDARACVRFFRNTIENESNPWGVDSERIILWGAGTGGFLSLGAGYLDSFEELELEKFIDTETALNFVDTTMSSNVNGDTNTPLNIANNPGFSNDVAMVVNMSGALGDVSWVNNTSDEPVMVGFHSLNDPFSPFSNGGVFNPVNNDFVIDVSGTRAVVGALNGENGGLNVNESTDGASELDFADPSIEAINEVFSETPITFRGQETTLSTDNMFTFLSGTAPLAGPWDWHDQATLEAVVAVTNAATGGIFDFNADTLLNNALMTNPNLSRENANLYLDTVMTFFYPRAFLALDLENVGVNVDKIPLVEAGMTMSPNPSSASVIIKTDFEYQIVDMGVYDMTGKLVQFHVGINTNEYTIHKKNLPPGMYLVKARFEEGIQTQKVLFE